MNPMQMIPSTKKPKYAYATEEMLNRKTGAVEEVRRAYRMDYSRYTPVAVREARKSNGLGRGGPGKRDWGSPSRVKQMLQVNMMHLKWALVKGVPIKSGETLIDGLTDVQLDPPGKDSDNGNGYLGLARLADHILGKEWRSWPLREGRLTYDGKDAARYEGRVVSKARVPADPYKSVAARIKGMIQKATGTGYEDLLAAKSLDEQAANFYAGKEKSPNEEPIK